MFEACAARLALVAALCPLCAFAGVMKVGTFLKATGSQPVDQSVAHGLGTSPKALILWSAGRTDENIGTYARGSIGFTDGTTSRAVALAAANGAATTNASRRMADAVFTSVSAGEVLRLEAVLVRLDASDFVLRWTTNSPAAEEIHFAVLGGSDVQAKVVQWSLPVAPGNLSVGGIGFQPDAVLHLHAGVRFDTGVTGPDAQWGTGAMDGAGNVWANAFHARDGQTGGSVAWAQQRTDRALIVLDQSTLAKSASFVSMDADGFTLGFGVAAPSTGNVVSLALRGFQTRAGGFATNGTAAPEIVTQPGFAPELLLVSSFNEEIVGSVIADCSFSFGAADRTSFAVSSAAIRSTVNPTESWSVDHSSRFIHSIDVSNGSLGYSGTLTPTDAGFTVPWIVAPPGWMDQHLYLALRPVQSCGACEPDAGTSPGADAGTSPGADAGTVDPPGPAPVIVDPLRLPVGCGCAASGGWLGLLGLALWWMAGRRSRARNQL